MEIEKIKRITPEAEISQAGETVIKIPADKLHATAKALHDDKEEPMDFLRDIVGMDWGEEGLGALYLLESTHTGARIILKSVAADRERHFYRLSAICGKRHSSKNVKCTTFSASSS